MKTAKIIMIVSFMLLIFTANAFALQSSLPNTNADAGTTVDIPLNIDDSSRISGFQYTITFNPSVLVCSMVLKGQVLIDAENNDFQSWSVAYNANIPGEIRFAGFEANAQELTGAGGTLARIRCTAGSTPEVGTPLSFTFAKLVDSLAQVIPSTTADGAFTINGVSPDGSIIINNGAVWTNTAAVTLVLECTDSESGCAEMRFSNDNVNFTPWEPFAQSRSWTLSSGDGEKLVYVQYLDGAGNWSESFSDSINLDTTKPVVKGVSDSPDPFNHHLGEKSTISFTLLDNLSVTCTIQAKIYNSGNKLVRTIKKNGVSCPAGGASSSVKWDGRNSKGDLVPAGTYTYKIQARDVATNRSAIKQGTVGVE